MTDRDRRRTECEPASHPPAPARSCAEAALLADAPWLRRVVAKTLASEKRLVAYTTVDDVVQTTLLAAFENLSHETLHPVDDAAWWTLKPRLRAYLIGVVRHALSRLRRDPWNTRRLPVSLANASLHTAASLDRSDPGPGPDEVLESKYQLEGLESCLDRLPRKDRFSLLLFACGWSIGDVATALRTSSAAARKRQRRVLARVRSMALARREGSGDS